MPTIHPGTPLVCCESVCIGKNADANAACVFFRSALCRECSTRARAMDIRCLAAGVAAPAVASPSAPRAWRGPRCYRCTRSSIGSRGGASRSRPGLGGAADSSMQALPHSAFRASLHTPLPLPQRCVGARWASWGWCRNSTTTLYNANVSKTYINVCYNYPRVSQMRYGCHSPILPSPPAPHFCSRLSVVRNCNMQVRWGIPREADTPKFG